jgi:hypothetical protein
VSGERTVVAEAENLIDTGLTMLRRGSQEVVDSRQTVLTSSRRDGRPTHRPSSDRPPTLQNVQSIMTFFGAPGASEKSRAVTRLPKCSQHHGASVVGQGPGSCCNCGSEDVVMHAVDSMRCCKECDAVEYIVIDNERPAKSDVPRDSMSFSFKRLSHFNEWLSQIQGKDHPSIPENVIGFVMVELKRNYIINAADVKTSQVRAILKKLKLSKYYEHVPYNRTQTSRPLCALP